MSDTAIIARKLTAHADCDHPATKTARAACRRARAAGGPVWADVTQAEATRLKGETVRVTMQSDDAERVFEGTLVGWGAKRIIVSVDGVRHQFSTDALISVQAHA